MKTILVIGAGFCGTVTAAQLLRNPPPGPLRIILLNRSGLMARGVAYGTRTESHVLNVPAGRMGAFPEEPDGFLKFARRYDTRIGPHDFLPRRLYGEYLEWLLSEAARASKPACAFRAMVGEAVQIRMAAGGSGAMVELDHGECIFADRVVLAMGNYAPAHPRLGEEARAFFRSPRYVRDPWRPEALQVTRLDQPALLVGSGLTMLDVLLDLRARGHVAPILALSRHGLLPQPHREQDQPPAHAGPQRKDFEGKAGARAYFRTVRRWLDEAQQQGRDWRDVIGALRPITPSLWQSLSVVERRRFLRHLRPYWEVHRHRCAPQSFAPLQKELDAGSMQLIAGRIVNIEERVDAAVVHYRPRGAEETRSLTVGTVINCTGPDSDARNVQEPLLGQLSASGNIVADGLGLGFLTEQGGRLLNREGKASRALYYVGPFLRAQHWEATAVPELREHVSSLVADLGRSLAEEPPITAAALRFA